MCYSGAGVVSACRRREGSASCFSGSPLISRFCFPVFSSGALVISISVRSTFLGPSGRSSLSQVSFLVKAQAMNSTVASIFNCREPATRSDRFSYGYRGVCYVYVSAPLCTCHTSAMASCSTADLVSLILVSRHAPGEFSKSLGRTGKEMTVLWAWPISEAKWAFILSTFLSVPLNLSELCAWAVWYEDKWAWINSFHLTKSHRALIAASLIWCLLRVTSPVLPPLAYWSLANAMDSGQWFLLDPTNTSSHQSLAWLLAGWVDLSIAPMIVPVQYCDLDGRGHQSSQVSTAASWPCEYNYLTGVQRIKQATLFDFIGSRSALCYIIPVPSYLIIRYSREIGRGHQSIFESMSLDWLGNYDYQMVALGVSQDVWSEVRRSRWSSFFYQNLRLPGTSLRLMSIQSCVIVESSRPELFYSHVSLSLRSCLRIVIAQCPFAASYECECLVPPSSQPLMTCTENAALLYWIPLLNLSFMKSLQISSLWERSLSPPSSSSTEISLPPPFSSFMERALSSSVLLAMDLALRAFVDHLVVLGLKKVASTPTFRQCALEVLALELGVFSTSDNDCISVNMFMNSWNQVSPSKLKDVTTVVGITLAPILLASLLISNVVVDFCSSSVTVWVENSSSFGKCNHF